MHGLKKKHEGDYKAACYAQEGSESLQEKKLREKLGKHTKVERKIDGSNYLTSSPSRQKRTPAHDGEFLGRQREKTASRFFAKAEKSSSADPTPRREN